ncbi:YicC/YloC family endoribonuclease [Neisseria bergeri]|uniref:YicC/YloC family endoribonuclease n=1 Tax=Neisseria bergeri TaxID=1906581 RepID=UPI00272B03F3|nr:YicC/YloC family endoribonuclease [Neisseria bergeri]
MSSGNIHIHSMTGFANAAAECGSKRINLDIRAVNHRFLDIQIRMPDDLRHLESGIREQISSHIARGKVECKIQIQDTENRNQSLELNRDLVGQLAEINKDLRKHHDLAKLGIADILRFPGVLASQRENTEELAKSITELTEKALKDFTAARKREGKKLGEHLLQRIEAMEEIIGALSEIFPALVEAHKEKIRARLAEAVGSIDNDRLQQEFALFVQKSDVDEEFSRLRTHIGEVRRIVTEHKGSSGKRLDFLMQELNREANTLGSKSIAAECTQASVELKVLIEQMREQVQNIE